MATEAPAQDQPTTAAESSETTGQATPAPAAAPPTLQLSQVRAPLEDAAQVLGLNDPKGASGKASSVQVLLPTPRRPKRKKSRAGRPSVGDTALP